MKAPQRTLVLVARHTESATAAEVARVITGVLSAQTRWLDDGDEGRPTAAVSPLSCLARERELPLPEGEEELVCETTGDEPRAIAAGRAHGD